MVPAFYLARRIGIFFLIVWLAATLNFFLPRIGGENPVAQKVMQMAALGGNLHAGMQDMVKEYESKFGIDKPLWKQYLNYLVDMSRFDFGYSIANYPRRVSDMILEGLPWTISLITVTTVISFVIGNVLGAFQAWPRAPRWIMIADAAAAFAERGPVLSARADPGLCRRLPFAVGAAVRRLSPPARFRNGASRSRSTWPGTPILPATRDHPGFARRLGARHARDDGDDARRGLRHLRRGEGSGGSHPIRRLRHPQRHASASDRACAVARPTRLRARCSWRSYSAIPASARCCSRAWGSDFFLVQGIVFIVIVAIGLATLILDLIYPLLDPRIVQRSA